LQGVNKRDDFASRHSKGVANTVSVKSSSNDICNTVAGDGTGHGGWFGRY
jgi:hypothetical protein